MILLPGFWLIVLGGHEVREVDLHMIRQATLSTFMAGSPLYLHRATAPGTVSPPAGKGRDTRAAMWDAAFDPCRGAQCR